MNEDNDATTAAWEAIAKALGRRLKTARVARGIDSRRDAARLADLPFKTVGRIERGEHVSTPQIWQYARALGVELSEAWRQAEEDARRTG